MAALRGALTDPATWGEAPEKADFPAEVENMSVVRKVGCGVAFDHETDGRVV